MSVPEPAARPPVPRGRRWPWLVAAAVVAVGAYALRASRPSVPVAGTPRSAPAVPVVTAKVRRGDLPVHLSGLGNVAAFNTVSVKSRVDGQIVAIRFQEGQLVHAGDVLAEIDPRPFQVQLAQAEGQLARDRAQLEDARLTLERYRALWAERVVSKQELDDQAAKVGQFEGAVRADQGAIDGAKLALAYARVTAPITGRVGLRQVDVGNVVHANDANGIVVLTQLQPIAVLFTIPEDELPPVARKLAAGEQLAVVAFDRSGRTKLAEGTLLTTDNRIDPSTGTTRLKAVFPNDDGALFPNQFVNVQLLLDVRRDAVVAPIAAVQRGPQGTFVYVVKADRTVAVRPVTVGPQDGDDAVVETGLVPDEVVVVDGVDKLRAGSVVQERPAAGAMPAPGA
ncbi:MAG TPA: MdtA/MuxA family multidrug efflux RND transporter periplasmic adaptor subunit [Candidatus Binatia bacterium]|nr:MdtA/MuxA family multidrug efflux RND transporter periplasmic adaptor subunit [Candidatus Binatia bacterium]